MLDETFETMICTQKRDNIIKKKKKETHNIVIVL